MTGAIYHRHYKIIPDRWAQGFWVALCRETDCRYSTQRCGYPGHAERAVLDHLKGKHDIEGTEARA